MRINPIELASELAHDRMLSIIRMLDPKIEEDFLFDEVDGVLTYKEFAQDEFNHWYDYYLTRVERCEEVLS